MGKPLKLTDKTELIDPSKGDWFHTVDVSDTTGSTQGTSKKISHGSVIANEYTLIDNTAFKALGVTAIELVPEKAGYIIAPLSVDIIYDEGSTANTTSHGVFIGYDIINTTGYFWSNVRRAFYSPTYNAVSWNLAPNSVGGVFSTSHIGKKLIIWLDGSPHASCDGSLKVWTTYRYIRT